MSRPEELAGECLDDVQAKRLCVLKFGSSVLEREEDYPKVVLEIYRHVRDRRKGRRGRVCPGRGDRRSACAGQSCRRRSSAGCAGGTARPRRRTAVGGADGAGAQQGGPARLHARSARNGAGCRRLAARFQSDRRSMPRRSGRRSTRTTWSSCPASSPTMPIMAS